MAVATGTVGIPGTETNDIKIEKIKETIDRSEILFETSELTEAHGKEEKSR